MERTLALFSAEALLNACHIAPSALYAALTPVALVALTLLLRTIRYQRLPTLDHKRTSSTHSDPSLRAAGRRPTCARG